MSERQNRTLIGVRNINHPPRGHGTCRLASAPIDRLRKIGRL